MVKKNESSFPVEQAPASYFTGDASIKRFVRNTDIRTNVAKVTFEPGARTHWHTHPKGQILIVTEGKGYAQKKGEPVQLLLPGDVVTFAPDEEHWHGATPGDLLTHIAIQPVSDNGDDVSWLDQVTEDEYLNFV